MSMASDYYYFLQENSQNLWTNKMASQSNIRNSSAVFATHNDSLPRKRPRCSECQSKSWLSTACCQCLADLERLQDSLKLPVVTECWCTVLVAFSLIIYLFYPRILLYAYVITSPVVTFAICSISEGVGGIGGCLSQITGNKLQSQITGDKKTHQKSSPASTANKPTWNMANWVSITFIRWSQSSRLTTQK